MEHRSYCGDFLHWYLLNSHCQLRIHVYPACKWKSRYSASNLYFNMAPVDCGSTHIVSEPQTLPGQRQHLAGRLCQHIYYYLDVLQFYGLQWILSNRQPGYQMVRISVIINKKSRIKATTCLSTQCSGYCEPARRGGIYRRKTGNGALYIRGFVGGGIKGHGKGYLNN